MNIIMVSILSATFYFKNKAADRGETLLEADEVRHPHRHREILD